MELRKKGEVKFVLPFRLNKNIFIFIYQLYFSISVKIFFNKANKFLIKLMNK